MEDKIAVQCKTEEEWDKVRAKVMLKAPYWNVEWGDHHGEDSCIMESGFHNGSAGWTRVPSCHREGYTIISASEYLNEGGKDVSEFKKEDSFPSDYSIFLENASDMDKVKDSKVIDTSFLDDSEEYGYHTRIIVEDGEVISFGELSTQYTVDEWLEIAIKPQTTKENNMNTNISNVFEKTKEALLVEKHLGNQIGTSFIDGLILADKKDDVLKEAKRLEKEEKDK